MMKTISENRTAPRVYFPHNYSQLHLGDQTEAQVDLKDVSEAGASFDIAEGTVQLGEQVALRVPHLRASDGSEVMWLEGRVCRIESDNFLDRAAIEFAPVSGDKLESLKAAVELFGPNGFGLLG